MNADRDGGRRRTDMQELESLKDDKIRMDFIGSILNILKKLDEEASTNGEHELIYLLSLCLAENIDFE